MSGLDSLVTRTKKLDSHFHEPFKTFGCDIERITFEDVLRELEEQFEQIVQFKNAWIDCKEIIATLESALSSARWKLDRVKELINKSHCIQKKVLDYTRLLLETQNNEDRELLAQRIGDVAKNYLIFIY